MVQMKRKSNLTTMMGMKNIHIKKTFEGVINNLERRFLESDSEWKREAIAEYQSDTACEGCNGLRSYCLTCKW